MGLGKSLYRSGEYDEAYDVLILVIEKKIERYIEKLAIIASISPVITLLMIKNH